MQTYGQRVRIARERVGWSQEKLARELGIKQPSVHALEAGTAAGSKYSFKIAQKTGVRPAWLETGDGAMEGHISDERGAPPAPLRPAATTDLNPHAMPRDIPVLGGALCGDDGLFEFNGQTLDYARRPPRLIGIKDAYAVYTNGECMAPWREHGQLVYVHPHQPARIGDYVVVQLKAASDGGPIPAYIKRLVKRTAAEVRLLQYNPRKEIAIPARKIAAIHLILDWSELMSV